MKQVVTILILIPSLSFGAFTEFYCQSGGSNLNAGSTTNNTAAYTSVNGNWNGTSTFTPVDGSTPANTVNVGDFASVYLDAATTAVYIARVTAVAAGVNGAITLSTTVKSGSPPSSGATGRSIKVGGAWLGPNGTSGFPLTFLLAALRNTSGNVVRINLKNDQTYSVTAQMVWALDDACWVQGYSSSPGDLGKATISGGTSGASYTVVAGAGGGGVTVADLVFANNGATGAAVGVTFGTSQTVWLRCVFRGMTAGGKAVDSQEILIECEAYGNNTSNTANQGGFQSAAAVAPYLLRCFSHDNTGSNTAGFHMNSAGESSTNIILDHCISADNGGNGVNWSGIAGSTSTTAVFQLRNCDIYQNGGDGLKILTNNTGNATTSIYIESCNFVKNTGWAINGIALSSNTRSGYMFNCGFGSGSAANGSGNVNTSTVDNLIDLNSVTYGSGLLPWVDPNNGDFRVNLAAANAAGRGSFTQADGSYTGTVGYPDIGAAQSKTGPGGTFSKEVSYGVPQ